jgi:hypothetical protein
MKTIEELFAMSNQELLEAWRLAKVAEIEETMTARRGKPSADLEAIEAAQLREMSKLEATVIRLVISFRLMGRDDPPDP